MRKRALVVEQFAKSRKGWRLELSSTDMASLGAIIQTIREIEKNRGLLIVNRQDPFADVFDGEGAAKVRKKGKMHGPSTATPITRETKAHPWEMQVDVDIDEAK